MKKDSILLDEASYNLCLEMLKKPVKKQEKSENNNNRLFDTTKWDEMSKEIQFEEIVSNPYTENAINTENKNDYRKIRAMFEKPSITNNESCLIFKNEGDFYLKIKDFKLALKSYEYALSFLFITKFNDDDKETELQKELKNSIFMNIAFSHIQTEAYSKALDYLIESNIYDKKNLKTIYRLAFVNYKLKEYEKSLEYCNTGLISDPDNKEFNGLKNDIINQQIAIENKSKKLFKKLLN